MSSFRVELSLTHNSAYSELITDYRLEVLMTVSWFRMLLGGFAICVFAIVTTLAQQGTKGGDWKAYGGDEGSTRYSPLDQINRDNIKDLRVACDTSAPCPVNVTESCRDSAASFFG